MKQKIFVTKYALTKGILEYDAEINEGEIIRGKTTRAYVSIPGCVLQGFYGSDFHLTRAEAVEQANKMVEDKIKSLNKKIAKLNNLKFE